MENRYSNGIQLLIIISLRWWITYVERGARKQVWCSLRLSTKASTSTLRGWRLGVTPSRYGPRSPRHYHLRRTSKTMTTTSKRCYCSWRWHFWCSAVGPKEKTKTTIGSPARYSASSRTTPSARSSFDRTLVAARPSTVRPTALGPVLCTACIRQRILPVRAVAVTAPRPSTSVSGTWPSSPGYRLFPVCSLWRGLVRPAINQKR